MLYRAVFPPQRCGEPHSARALSVPLDGSVHTERLAASNPHHQPGIQRLADDPSVQAAARHHVATGGMPSLRIKPLRWFPRNHSYPLERAHQVML